MSKKIKAVNIVDEVVNEETKILDEEDKPVEEHVIEQTKIEEPENVEQSEDNTDESKIEESKIEESKIEEIIKEGTLKPKPSRKMITCPDAEGLGTNKARRLITCPDCNKSMLEKNFRYQHINVCGKVKTPKLRAKPIEEVIKEKREKAKPIIETKTEQPEVIVEKPVEPLIPPPKPDYWTLRREYANQMRERKTILAKRLVSKALTKSII